MSLDVSTGPQVNKFEQVSSDGHQISIAGGYLPRSDVQRGKGYPLMSDAQRSGRRYPLRSDVQEGGGTPYHVTYSMMCVMYLPPTPHTHTRINTPVDGQMKDDRRLDACEYNTFPQLRLRAVKIELCSLENF